MTRSDHIISYRLEHVGRLTDRQVTSWLPTNPGGIHKALFVVFGGANDVFFKPTISATASVNALTEAINRLRGHGRQSIYLAY